MSRLVVVSNRLPHAAASTSTSGPTAAGGLVSVLLDSLVSRPGSLWLGWDPAARPGRSTRRRLRGVELVGLGLSPAQIEGYYNGFCNQALWPILHSFPSRARLRSDDFAIYRGVQRRFASRIAARLEPRDRVWIHDYHLLGLGGELRRQGFRGRLGFFLHTPFPPFELWSLLPASAELFAALDAVDLVGFQTRRDRANYLDCRRELARHRPAASAPRPGRASTAVFPVGVTAGDFEPTAAVLNRPKASSYLSGLVAGRKVILGVDRLDYTKGIVERFRAFDALLSRQPEWRGRVCLVQIAAPSRGDVELYRDERRELESLAGRINGERGEVDWTPIRYLHRALPRAAVARLYRGADVGLVTPLRDGMNLVAKEFVAAQRPNDPGVLVLSRFAGAAESLTEALLVNPYLIEETAETIAAALVMPLAERQSRHRRLLSRVRRDSAERWATAFLGSLASARARAGQEPGGTRSPRSPVRLGEP